jgi:ribonucleoside-diphosphate reductase alpha chain
MPAVPASEPVVVRATNGQQQELSFEAYNGGETFMGTCPDCGSQLEYAEGCVKCHVCGFSECG